jgi:hypothetical protein
LVEVSATNVSAQWKILKVFTADGKPIAAKRQLRADSTMVVLLGGKKRNA